MKSIGLMADGENSASAQLWLPRGTGLILALLTIPMLLSPYGLWDGRILYHALDTGQDLGIRNWFTTSGWHLQYYIFWLVEQIAGGTGLSGFTMLRLITVGSLIGMAYEGVRFGEGVGRLPRFWALAMGAAVAAFPTWNTLLGEVLFMYVLCSWLVLLAVRLIHSDTLRGYLIGMPLLIVSLQLNSNFVFSIALAAAYLASDWVTTSRVTRGQIIRFAVIVIPVVIAFVLLRTLYTPRGEYADYNKFSLSALNLKILVVEAARYLEYALLISVVLLAAFGLCEGLARLNVAARADRPAGATDLRERARALLWPFVLSIVMMGAAAFPYLAVGKSVDLRSADDWELRHTIPMALPVALFMVSGARLLASWPGIRRSALWFVPLLAALLVLVGFQQMLLWGKLERSAYEAGMIEALKTIPAPPRGLVEMDLQDPPAPALRYYETNWLLYRAYGREDWLSRQTEPPSFVDTPAWLARKDSEYLANKSIYIMRGYAEGCRTELRFSGPHYGFWRTAGWMLGGSLPNNVSVVQTGSECPAQGSSSEASP